MTTQAYEYRPCVADRADPDALPEDIGEGALTEALARSQLRFMLSEEFAEPAYSVEWVERRLVSDWERLP
jgi:hypothetical protein